MIGVRRVVSVSGGKDSQAVAILALKRFPREELRLVTADTGHEHEITYQHIEYLRGRFNCPIDVVKADFTTEIARKRRYVLEKWPEKGVPADICERAAATLETPSGNPFLDLCIWKGRFPSRMAQFCTQELKRIPLDAYILELAARGHAIESWQGVRRDESPARRNLLKREQTPEGWLIRRPIAAWTAQQVVDLSRREGVDLNPLYRMGMDRVGCAPCINCSKKELASWAQRYPEVIDKLREWEHLVGLASKAQRATFFTDPIDADGMKGNGHIDDVVEWAKTSRGGKSYDLFKQGPAPACASSYGLCE